MASCKVTRIWMDLPGIATPQVLVTPINVLDGGNAEHVLDSLARSLNLGSKGLLAEYRRCRHVFLLITRDSSLANQRSTRLARKLLRKLKIIATVDELPCTCHGINKISGWVVTSLDIVSPLFCCVSLMRMGSFKRDLNGDRVVYLIYDCYALSAHLK